MNSSKTSLLKPRLACVLDVWDAKHEKCPGQTPCRDAYVQKLGSMRVRQEGKWNVLIIN